MVTLNLQNTTEINLITTSVSLANTSLTSLLSNAASSTYINKVVSITVSNNSASAANITLAYYSAAALGGTAYPIASTVSVPAYGSLILLDAGTFIYLKDDSSLGVTAGTGGVLSVTCAYAKITAVEEFVPTPPGPQAGGLWVFGRNTDGQLGLSNTANRSSPVQVGALATWLTGSVTYSSNEMSFVSIKSDGTLWTWGNNNNGQLAQNDKVARSSPVQVGALTNWSKAKTVDKSMWAIKTDGTLWAWGYNYFANLGTNDTAARSSPTQIGSLTTWSKLGTALAIKTDGTLWAWGRNAYGRIGQGNTIYRSSPVQVGALTTWANATGWMAVLATKTDGTLWSWGRNSNTGVLGQNNRINLSSPVQVGALTNWSISENQLYSGGLIAKAIKSDGSFWTWGRNYAGQLGLNDLVYRSSPVQLGSSTDWSFIGGAGSIKTNGTLWAWGQNGYGQLGQNDTVQRSSPVQVGALTTWQKCYGVFSLFGIKT